MDKYVYWFKIRQSGTYSPSNTQGVYNSRVYFGDIGSAKQYQKEHKVEMHISATNKTIISYPRMYKKLRKDLPKLVYVNN